jgi:hypothetical protein
MQVGASWPAAFEQDCFGFAEEAFDQQWRRRSPSAERQVAAATACPVGGLPIRRGPDQIDGGRGQCVADDPRGGLLPASVGRLEPRQPSEGRRAWRLYAPIASPSWPAPGLGAALLGAVLGGAMGLVVEHAGTGTAGAAPRPRRGSIENDALGATGSEQTSGAGRASCWMVTSAGFGAWLAA